MTANLSTRRIDDYGPVEPWRRMKITDADPIDDAVYGSLKLILDEPEVRRSIRAVADETPPPQPGQITFASRQID